MADNRDLQPYLERLGTARILCIGDVMLDHTIYGEVARVSPEAPVPVLSVERELKSLGGAGNVLRNLWALGTSPSFISVIGDDDTGREIGRLLEAQDGTEVHVLVQPQRATTVKTRYIAANHQLLRADRHSAVPLDPYIREDLLRLARELVTDRAVVIVSDYGEGVLTEGVALEIIRAGCEAGARVIVDPQGGDPIRYRGAHLVRPSRGELARATGMPVATAGEIAVAGRALIDRCSFGGVLVTLGGEGSLLVTAAGIVRLERTASGEVYDPSGAEDTLIAALGAGVAAGMTPVDAARFANVAAGAAAGRVGTAIIYGSELRSRLGGDADGAPGKLVSPAVAMARAEEWHRQGLRVGFTNGCFDLLHPGHVALLRQAKAACDRLVVGLNSDASAARLKGPSRPIENETLRAAALGAHAAVDLVVIFEADTPVELIRALRPQLLVKGTDYRADEVVGADLVKSGGGEILLAEVMPGYGTSTSARSAR
ncbi:MAG TPA: PfkB family carbohydrate kinase [Stellaceae bacterium]|nr:PfkB family carbohydrate kinase [Stellaceae bacterium]